MRAEAVLLDWDSSALTQPAAESWLLRRSAPGAEAFQHPLTELSARRVHLVRSKMAAGSPLAPSPPPLLMLSRCSCSCLR